MIVENRFPFILKEETPLVLDVKILQASQLELQSLEGKKPVYLFTGALSKSECEAAITSKEGGPGGFEIGAAVGQAAFMSVPADLGKVTLFCPETNRGYFRTYCP